MIRKIGVLLLASSMLFGCDAVQNSNKTQRGAVIGATGGALLGAILGNNIKGGSSELGAVLGGVVGGAAGGVIGNQMDKQAKKIEEEIPGAEVKRIDDGIVVTFDENSEVRFASSKHDITAESAKALDKLIAVLTEYPDTNIVITGNTDSTGGDEMNMKLSERRASSVASYLKGKGISGARITTKGLGETAPIADNSTKEGRSKNRRVDIVIVPNEKMKQDAKAQVGE